MQTVRLTILALFLSCGALLLVPAGSQAVELGAFYGKFQGMGVAEDAESIYFETTVRELTLEIRPAGNGFEIAWSTAFNKGGDPNAPKRKERSASVSFIPSGKPGVYVSNNTSPFEGPVWWAAFKGQTLFTYMMQVDDEGRWLVQQYERTLTGSGMELVFSRHRDGEDLRTVKGRLNRLSY